MENKLAWLMGLVVALAVGSIGTPATENAEQSPPPSSEPEVKLADVLEGGSGVRVATMCTNCNVAAVTMLGQSDDRVQVRQDGLPVVGGLGAIYVLSILPSEGIASTEIVRGAGTVTSGAEAGAGAVVLRTRGPQGQKRPYLFASMDFGSLSWNSQKFLGSHRWGKFGAQVAVTHAQSDGSDPNGDGNFDLGAFDRWTGGATATYEFTKHSVIRLDALDYDEEQRGSKGGYFETEPTHFLREDIDIHRREGSLGWDHAFRDRGRLTARYRYGRRDQDTSKYQVAEPPKEYMEVDEIARNAEVVYERPLGDRHLLTLGAFDKNVDMDGDVEDLPLTDQVIGEKIQQRGGFAQVRLALPARVELTAGVRYDRFTWSGAIDGRLGAGFPYSNEYENQESRGTPRLTLAWKATDYLALSLSAGRAFQAPRPVFERVCCGAQVQSNSLARAEKSKNLLFDADWVPRRWLKLRGSLFRSDIDDYIQKFVTYEAATYIPTYSNVNYPNAELQGGEIAFEMRFFDRLSYGAEWTRLRARSAESLTVYLLPDVLRPPLFPYQTVEMPLPSGQMPYLPQDQGSAFIRWDDPQQGLKISLQAQYKGSLSIQVMDGEVGPLQGNYQETTSFWALNFRAQKRIHKGLSVFAGVDNLTDEYQTWLDDPRYEYNWGLLRGRYYYGGVSFEM